MCLLITQPEGTVFDLPFLTGVYGLNPDGVGVMYAHNNEIITSKYLPNNLGEFLKFYDEEIKSRKCAWHMRLRTHGDIDLDNCHPYEVVSEAENYPLFLMHNGILPTGNKNDVTKSDTWHFIQDMLRPMLVKNPEFFLTDTFASLIGDYIDDNRFVLMDALGNTVTVNEHQGVEYNGAWLSNTYAWDTTGTRYDDRYDNRHTSRTPMQLSLFNSYDRFGTGEVWGGSDAGYDEDAEDFEAWAKAMIELIGRNSLVVNPEGLRACWEVYGDESWSFVCDVEDGISSVLDVVLLMNAYAEINTSQKEAA